MIDCLIIGYNDVPFDNYVSLLQAMGRDKGAYRDLNLAFVTHQGEHYRTMDLLNRFHTQPPELERSFNNVDFLWPVITYLYTYVARRGFTADYVNLFQRDKEQLIDKLQNGDVRTVVITTTLYVWMPPIVEIIALVREYSSTTKIIVGGPYIHNQSQSLNAKMLDDLLASIGADIYVISAEGEAALVNILAALRDGTPLSRVDNIVYRDGDDLVRTAESRESSSLPENMIDYPLFRSDEFNGFVSLRTAKSCPFSCSFCAFPSRAGAYTYLPLELVERELDAIYNMGTITTLSFIDDTFNVPKGRFKDVMRLMIRKKYGFRWNSYLRSDHADSECVELMQASGCDGVFLGVESGSNTILKAMNKTSRREDYLRIIPQLSRAGIVTHANVIIGFPGETLETVNETIDLIESAKPMFYRAQLWYCDPTTPIWQKREELGVRGSGFVWSHPTMTSDIATDLVERLFLDVRNSTWLPQYGFELWSVFYLQRRGMPLAQVREFVRRFNTAVRAKIVDPSVTEISDEHLAAIREACVFTDTAPYRTLPPPPLPPPTPAVVAQTIPLSAVGVR